MALCNIKSELLGLPSTKNACIELGHCHCSNFLCNVSDRICEFSKCVNHCRNIECLMHAHERLRELQRISSDDAAILGLTLHNADLDENELCVVQIPPPEGANVLASFNQQIKRAMQDLWVSSRLPRMSIDQTASERFRSAFATGTWIKKKEPVVRLSYLSTLAYLRRIDSPSGIL